MQTESNLFLSTLFFDKPDNTFILIWVKTETEKSSTWLRNYEVLDGAENLDKYDIYFGVGLSPQNFGPYQRCKIVDIAGIPGFWIDIDIADGVHKKTNLPPSLDDALALLDQVPFKPSIVVKTGGGIQAYWLFNNLWMFGDNSERERAKEFSQKWVYQFKTLAAGYGWDIDATQDLARVMRLPGTNNWKTGQPRPVEILEWSDRRYTVLELCESVEGISLPQSATKAAQKALESGYKPDFDMAEVKGIDFEKWDLLCDIYPKLRQTFNHKRKDFVDQSLSIYDLALAAILKNNGWSDQETIDLLIYHRKKYGDDGKTGRADYYERTLSRVYTLLDFESLPVDVIADQAAEDNDAPAAEPNSVEALDQRRAVILEHLSKQLALPISAFVRVHAEPIYFRLELETGQKIKLGGTAQIVNQNVFRAKVGDETLILIPKKTKAQWDAIVAQLLSIKVVLEEWPDPFETGAGFVKFWIPRYLIERPPLALDDPAVLLEEANFIYKGEIYIQFSGFQSWLKRKDQDLKKLTHEAFRAAGLQSEKRSVKHTSVFGWRVPLYLTEGVQLVKE